MFCGKSVEAFDQKVQSILVKEFKAVLEMGLLSEEALLPVVVEMRNSLREAFPEMSPKEAEIHLRQLQDQCREIAYRIFDVTYTTYWN